MIEREVKPNEELVMVWLLAETYQILSKLAHKKNKSVAWILADALSKYVEAESRSA